MPAMRDKILVSLSLSLSLLAVACTVGMSGGGAYSTRSPPNPMPGGFHGRFTGGLAWGSRYGTVGAIGSAGRVAKRAVVSGGAEFAIAVKPWKEPRQSVEGSPGLVRGVAVFGRVLHGTSVLRGPGEASIRVTELALGPGLGGLSPKEGVFNGVFYLTAARMTDDLGRVGWSIGVELSLSGPLSALISSWCKQSRDACRP